MCEEPPKNIFAEPPPENNIFSQINREVQNFVSLDDNTWTPNKKLKDFSSQDLFNELCARGVVLHNYIQSAQDPSIYNVGEDVDIRKPVMNFFPDK